MAFVSSAPVLATPRFSRSTCAVSPAFRTAFTGARAVVRSTPAVRPTTPRMEFEISEGVKFDLDLSILLLAFLGWVIPSSLPSGIPLTNGTGLTQAFFASMQANLANFPKGPAADDPFWTLMFLWHVGLFACMIFGTIGVNSRKAQS